MLKNLLTRKLVVVEPHSTVSEAAKMMEKEDVGCVLILDNDKPRGLLTDRDIVVRCVAKNVDVDDCTVENVMTESLLTVRDTDGIFECIETMHAAGVRRLPVVDEKNYTVGIISFDDLLAILSKELSGLAFKAITVEEPGQKKVA
jgi:predicted transcriptional regulator